jgi:hypothetical protein
LQETTVFTQIGKFGLRIHHLATLCREKVCHSLAGDANNALPGNMRFLALLRDEEEEKSLRRKMAFPSLDESVADYFLVCPITRSQFYDLELQSQRCKKIQRN